MRSTSPENGVVISWNGLHLTVPSHFEAIVSGLNHLIFEDDFKPVFQLRWKNIGALSPAQWQKKSDLWWQQLDNASGAAKLPKELEPLTDTFTNIRYYSGKQPGANGGLLYCDNCQTLLIFQHLDTEDSTRQKTAKVLSTVSCHGCSDNLWRIQDFAFTAPPEYSLTDYTFKAGLTRLSFSGDNCKLQICRLAQAESRLSAQSLLNILYTLADTRELQLEYSSDQTVCRGTRSPSITKQILFRLKRETPFIDSRLWLVKDHDRLLACVLSSKRPLPANALSSCYESFKII